MDPRISKDDTCSHTMKIFVPRNVYAGKMYVANDKPKI